MRKWRVETPPDVVSGCGIAAEGKQASAMTSYKSTHFRRANAPKDSPAPDPLRPAPRGLFTPFLAGPRPARRHRNSGVRPADNVSV